MDAQGFWRGTNLDELARQQGITGPVDLDAIYDNEVTDTERATFLAALTDLDTPREHKTQDEQD